MNFPQSTLGDWVAKGAWWWQPLVREMKRTLLAGDYVQVDETPVRVQDPDVAGKCATGWLWVGKAVRYCLNEWNALTRYLADGRLESDNKLTENAIRPSAVGKKNWLFIGHPEAGWRAAAVYTLIVSCRRRGIDPWQYLRDVLQRLPSLPQSELATLRPANWKPA